MNEAFELSRQSSRTLRTSRPTVGLQPAESSLSKTTPATPQQRVNQSTSRSLAAAAASRRPRDADINSSSSSSTTRLSPPPSPSKPTRPALEEIQSRNTVLEAGDYAEFTCVGLSDVRWLTRRPLVGSVVCELPTESAGPAAKGESPGGDERRGQRLEQPQSCEHVDERTKVTWKRLVMFAAVSYVQPNDSGVYICAGRMESHPPGVTLGVIGRQLSTPFVKLCCAGWHVIVISLEVKRSLPGYGHVYSTVCSHGRTNLALHFGQ